MVHTLTRCVNDHHGFEEYLIIIIIIITITIIIIIIASGRDRGARIEFKRVNFGVSS